MIIGAHVSTAGGIQNCFKNAEKIGAEGVQIFGASPRQWKVSLPDEKALKAFHEEKKRSGITEIYLHASYLVNLGTPDKDLYEKSLGSLAGHLQIANLLEAKGLIYHIGSYKNSTWEESAKRVAEGMHKVMKSTPGPAKLIMENSAGGGNKMGLTLEEIGKIYHLADSERIKICIDTAHAFGAGIIKDCSPAELDTFVKEADKAFGLENFVVMHVNDSLVPFDSQKDRHENIGEGEIGLTAFKNLAKNNFLGKLPWLLETPGFDGNGPDKKNVDILKSLG